MEAKWKEDVRRKALAWFDKNARDLPWRRTNAPYHVWISEIMLQQTQVVTVIPYFARFIARFPTIQALADADEQEALRLWEGLGYYRRARQLHKAARVICAEHGGTFPCEPADILALPGIGRYTAGAVRSIAFNQRAPILEANTIRVFSRLLGFAGDTASTKGQRVLWKAAEDLLPRKRPGDFNQAMMELGSEVCTPRDPACDACPLRFQCPTFLNGLQASIPAKKKKTKYEDLFEVCVVLAKDDQLLLRQCGDGERWAGLWDFPRFTMEPKSGSSLRNELAVALQQRTGISAHVCDRWMTIKHGVTRFRITLDCYKAYYHSGRRRKDSRWVSQSELEQLPLSSTGRQVAESLFGKPQIRRRGVR